GFLFMRMRSAHGGLKSVPELAFRDGVMDRIRLHESRYDEQAYLFVLSALEYSQSRLEARRHITAAELAASCRELALERFGLMTRMVLERWGVNTTSDIGEIVFTLVELGFLVKQPGDKREEFAGLYDFEAAFERDYPWNAAHYA
ncbi:MAG TPA: Minf_1886 family protein, partial [Gemmatimonadaceae bacterium]|nr:Minf_1886 family protein [Gemmatimonadaceae bacterium]